MTDIIYDTVVVGAGIAGLKAASVLTSHGKTCLVVEARDRIGGRLHTVAGYKETNRYDLGASWHHDTLTNRLFEEEVAEDKGAPFVFDDNDPVIIDKSGEIKDVSLRLVVDEIEKFIELYYHNDMEEFPKPDVALYDLLILYLQKRNRFMTDEQIWYGFQYARYMELWHGVSWYDLSARDSFFGHQGRNAFVLNYDIIYRRIANSIKETLGAIRLNTKVTKIARDGNKSGQEQLVYVEGSADPIRCKYVIVTIPQSLLSRNEVVFEPPLISNIAEALDKMHFGALGKVIFEFEDCNWDLPSSKIISMAHVPSDVRRSFIEQIRSSNNIKWVDLVQITKELLKAKEHDPWNQPLMFVNLQKTTGIPSFMMLMAPPLTQYVESLHDKTRTFEFFKPVLSKILEVFNAPSPIVNHMSMTDEVTRSPEVSGPILRNIIVTDWTNDEFAKGAYSACYPGDDALDVCLALSGGQSSKVRFAGEHTILDGAGCAYGAWESGEREALFVLDKIGK
ncbi:Cytochrome B pre-mRNA-processing protein 1 [Nakaseomyces bracarensis]|uniref:Cytochrome B pre-mRNA-processing protein 1 n=1 Tax=Nakaseomyces bracarensis TaxID=273131 RepID=A0ABR4NYE7_9SACH